MYHHTPVNIHNNKEDLQLEYTTSGNIGVIRTRKFIPYEYPLTSIIEKLNTHRGALFSSNYEYPGRYKRWVTGFINPPLVVSSQQKTVTIEALNERGIVLITAIHNQLPTIRDCIDGISGSRDKISIQLRKNTTRITEEERSKTPSVFTILRMITALFSSPKDPTLGLFGAFGYDLAFQFDPIEITIPRSDHQRDLVLYLPDELTIMDHYLSKAWIDSYDFSYQGESNAGLARSGKLEEYKIGPSNYLDRDYAAGEYSELVRQTQEKFKKGDLFEVVPSQTFYRGCTASPAELSLKLQQTNPSPYSFFINLGEQEYMIGASPEMFVRVTGQRIETCPIAGTIKRGSDAFSDSEQILKLLNSKKDATELTMCSDVDRNDKSRICIAGSVRIIGRRQIELYSRLIHTVDHIEGQLKEGMDAFDAFLSHSWAVTVTGAPKLWAMRFIETHEKSPRCWYGGAIGSVSFNGNMNTGLTLRCIHIKNGIAAVRVGATLLHDSIPEEEEEETELKASALLAVLAACEENLHKKQEEQEPTRPLPGTDLHILLIDHEDSFVHTLANYFRQTGATVTTVRSPVDASLFTTLSPDLIVLSPGPGSPEDFDCKATIALARSFQIPIFGVCLGLQALVEAFGGKLKQLDTPMHGKESFITITEAGFVFSGLAERIRVGRYHSLYADPDHFPDHFMITAASDDGIIMAIQHKEEPIAAVQFHPESLMSLEANAGIKIIENIVSYIQSRLKGSV